MEWKLPLRIQLWQEVPPRTYLYGMETLRLAILELFGSREPTFMEWKRRAPDGRGPTPPAANLPLWNGNPSLHHRRPLLSGREPTFMEWKLVYPYFSLLVSSAANLPLWNGNHEANS